MADNFDEIVYREVTSTNPGSRSNILKKEVAQYVGKTKISVEEENHEGVKIIIKKDASDNVREIKFVCSCGQTKSIMLDYSE